MLPVKTRLSVNVILIFKEDGKQLTIGCVSMNLFDEKKKFSAGKSDLNLWPFYEIDERLGCMKEYKGLYYDVKYNYFGKKGDPLELGYCNHLIDGEVKGTKAIICQGCFKEIDTKEEYYHIHNGVKDHHEGYHNDLDCLSKLRQVRVNEEDEDNTIKNIHNQFCKLNLEFE
jgi:hypothetical protein